MNLRVLPEVNADVGEALRWLVRKRRYRTAGNLWHEWQDGLAAVVSNPRQFPPAEETPVDREVRLYPTRRQGYLIVYEVTPSEIKVVAFLRGRRLPAVWLGRLDS